MNKLFPIRRIAYSVDYMVGKHWQDSRQVFDCEDEARRYAETYDRARVLMWVKPHVVYDHSKRKSA